MRSTILSIAYKLFPFSLIGDVQLDDINLNYDVSCVINFYKRINLLEGILYSLSGQNLSIERFEVILVEDRGGTEAGADIYEKFKTTLNIKYFTIPENYGIMGYSRNYGLSRAKGRYILFLDDDTVILKNNFLTSLINEFETKSANAVVPRGKASYCLIKDKYDFHDPYFPTNRCMAYSRDVLRELGGFVSEIVGQEDVEFVIRFLTAGRKFYQSEQLEYLHPPFVLSNLNKAIAVGISFANLKKRYPLIIWLMLLINGSRYLPLFLFPYNKERLTKGKFSLGFLCGIAYSIMGKKIDYI